MNPGSPAPQASVLIHTRPRALFTRPRTKSNELIINTLLKLKASGLKDSSLRQISYILIRLDKNTNITKPEQVKLYIADLKVAESYKTNMVKAYDYFATLNGIAWKRPRYRHESKIPNIPTRENIMKIISHAKKYAPIFKTLMETGLMPYELSQIESKDIDFERRILNARGYKGHASRTFKLTQETTAMLKLYFSKYDKFPASNWISKLWRQHRNAVSEKLQDPTLRNIRLYDLRHYLMNLDK